MATKIRLSTYWNDPEGWAGKAETLHAPGDVVSLENPSHAALLKDAGYEALDQQAVAAPARKAAAKKTAAKKTAAKKTASPRATS